MKLLSSIIFLTSLQAFSTPIVKGTANNFDSLVFCYDEKIGGNIQRFKVGFFGTGQSPNITLWKNKQSSNCDANFSGKAEPFAKNITEYSFNITNHSSQGQGGNGVFMGQFGQLGGQQGLIVNQNQYTAKSIEIILNFAGLNEPITETILLENL